MRIVDALGVVLAALSVIGAVTAYGQMDKRSLYEGTTAAVVDDKGNLRVGGHGVDDVSLVKPMPCTEQFGKRGHVDHWQGAVPHFAFRNYPWPLA